ncbi:uncharacterized [Tachysurus ichikawai]
MSESITARAMQGQWRRARASHRAWHLLEPSGPASLRRCLQNKIHLAEAWISGFLFCPPPSPSPPPPSKHLFSPVIPSYRQEKVHRPQWRQTDCAGGHADAPKITVSPSMSSKHHSNWGGGGGAGKDPWSRRFPPFMSRDTSSVHTMTGRITSSLAAGLMDQHSRQRRRSLA